MYQSTTLSETAIMQFRMLIKKHGIDNLSQDEITFLQLHFLEKLNTMQIAQLTEKEEYQIQKINTKFSIQNLPAIG